MSSIDYLPIELIQKIFTYLTADEILRSFYNLNSSLNSMVNKYNRYQLNFQRISMSNFDFLLQYINPLNVTSLTLSNLDDTPGQFHLFLSLFSLKQFSHLQNLQLIHPSNPTDFNQILIDLHHLESLQSLAVHHCQPASVNQQTFFIFSSFLNSSTSLRRLDLSGTLNHLFEYPFISSIKHLYFNDNIFNTISLEILTNRMPYLTSLDTAITVKTNPRLSLLTRLTLTIFINLTNSDLKALVNPMSKLQFLKIIANGKQWFNGHFWEECLPMDLQTFQFNFCTQSIHINEEMIFETFQTPFWMEKKRWFIMLDYQMNPTMTHLYSLPFCDQQFYYRPTINPIKKCRASIPIKNSYLDNVTKLTIDFAVLLTESYSTLTSSHFFGNISTLILSDIECHSSLECLFDFLKTILDLNHITELKLGHFHHPDLINILCKHMPKLKSLRITEKLLSQLETIHFLNIHRLSICDCLTDVHRMLSISSNIEYLCVKVMTFERMREVMELLDKTLINVTFRQVNNDLQKQFIQWLFDFYGEQRRFSYDSDRHMDLHVWLGDRF